MKESWKQYADEKNQSQKATYHVSPFIWNVQRGQSYKNKKQISGWLHTHTNIA